MPAIFSWGSGKACTEIIAPEPRKKESPFSRTGKRGFQGGERGGKIT
jgi:hypothetical protein